MLLNPHNLAVTFEGDQVHEKNPDVYQMIKDSVNLWDFATSMLVTFKVKDIPYSFDKMSMTPSFGEKRNKQSKVSKRFEFKVKH